MDNIKQKIEEKLSFHLRKDNTSFCKRTWSILYLYIQSHEKKSGCFHAYTVGAGEAAAVLREQGLRGSALLGIRLQPHLPPREGHTRTRFIDISYW